uniref:Uncharacterized protein n=1 Tax=Parascaris equorum TaxID=6256 RepID=A0A914RB43_PAREQ
MVITFHLSKIPLFRFLFTPKISVLRRNIPLPTAIETIVVFSPFDLLKAVDFLLKHNLPRCPTVETIKFLLNGSLKAREFEVMSQVSRGAIARSLLLRLANSKQRCPHHASGNDGPICIAKLNSGKGVGLFFAVQLYSLNNVRLPAKWYGIQKDAVIFGRGTQKRICTHVRSFFLMVQNLQENSEKRGISTS